MNSDWCWYHKIKLDAKIRCFYSYANQNSPAKSWLRKKRLYSNFSVVQFEFFCLFSVLNCISFSSFSPLSANCEYIMCLRYIHKYIQNTIFHTRQGKMIGDVVENTKIARKTTSNRKRGWFRRVDDDEDDGDDERKKMIYFFPFFFLFSIFILGV